MLVLKLIYVSKRGTRGRRCNARYECVISDMWDVLSQSPLKSRDREIVSGRRSGFAQLILLGSPLISLDKTQTGSAEIFGLADPAGSD